MVKLKWKKNYKKIIAMSVVVTSIVVVVLIYTRDFVQAQIEFGVDDAIYVDFQYDYEEILACLNGKEWDVSEEWLAEDLDAVLLCLDGMGQITEGGSDFIDEPEEINEPEEGLEEIEEDLEEIEEDLEEIEEGLEEELAEPEIDEYFEAEWECLDPDEWGLTVQSSDVFDITFECVDPNEDIFVAPPSYWNDEWGTLEIISMTAVDWDIFRAGDASGIKFIHFYSEFGATSFKGTDSEAGSILNWIYEHREELTDEEFANEAGTIFAVSVEFETGSCTYFGIGDHSFCQSVIFYMDEVLYQQLEDYFIWRHWE